MASGLVRGHRDDRQPHGERRAPSLAAAFNADRPAVRLDEVLDDRQPEPETAVTPRRRAIRLPERLEHRRQELSGNPAPVSATTISAMLPRARSRTRTVPPSGVNFTAFESRFQAICWSRAASP